MSNNNEMPPYGAWFSAIIAFFGTWVTAIVLFNFLGLVLGWIPALIVAVVVWATFPILYAILGFLIFIFFIICLVGLALLAIYFGNF